MSLIGNYLNEQDGKLGAAIERAEKAEAELETSRANEEHEGRENQTLRARVAEMEAERTVLATRIVNDQPLAWANQKRDHACASCVPGGKIVKPGFRCAFHLALSIVTARTTPSVSPSPALDPRCDQRDEYGRRCILLGNHETPHAATADSASSWMRGYEGTASRPNEARPGGGSRATLPGERERAEAALETSRENEEAVASFLLLPIEGGGT